LAFMALVPDCADAGRALIMRAAALALMIAFKTLFFSMIFSPIMCCRSLFDNGQVTVREE
jgi:hypothetical protein